MNFLALIPLLVSLFKPVPPVPQCDSDHYRCWQGDHYACCFIFDPGVKR